MASTGPTIAGAGATVDTGTGPAWTNPGNITAADLVYAEAEFTAGAGQSDDLKASTFGFAINAGATIVGIEVRATLSRTSSGDTVTYINVGKSDAALGTSINPGTSLTAIPTTYTFGGATSLWGLTWTPAEINASTFQVRIRGTASANFHVISCDAVWVNIYYTGAEGALSAAGVAVGSFVSSLTSTAAMSSAGVAAGNFISEGGQVSVISSQGVAATSFITSSFGGTRAYLPGVSFRGVRKSRVVFPQL